MTQRQHDRAHDTLRPIVFTRDYTRHAEGSVLACYGDTRVLCTASVVEGVPRFLKGKKQGWLTAEYGMLPRATHTRVDREATRGKQSGRTQEIQRLIGRSLRAAVDLKTLKDYTIYLDCDVLQADGGTRTAAISGACLALRDAVSRMQRDDRIKTNPFLRWVAAVSVGVCRGQVMLDLDYREDSNADTDMNVVMDEQGGIIEMQGTAERETFTVEQQQEMMRLAAAGIGEIIAKQRAVVADGN